MKDYQMMAAALYDGGWRWEDIEDIKAEYQLDQADASEIYYWLCEMDADVKVG